MCLPAAEYPDTKYHCHSVYPDTPPTNQSLLGPSISQSKPETSPLTPSSLHTPPTRKSRNLRTQKSVRIYHPSQRIQNKASTYRIKVPTLQTIPPTNAIRTLSIPSRHPRLRRHRSHRSDSIVLPIYHVSISSHPLCILFHL